MSTAAVPPALRCGRGLLCGHACTRARHPDTPCPDCASPCLISCPHASCPLPCASPCAPCLLPCNVSCPHLPACTRVCAAPCSRPSCHHRCEALLPCGHRCPSLCGEPCPSPLYCHVCAPPRIQDSVVDILGLAVYRDVSLDADPVILLACGHLFCVSTLDGIFEFPAPAGPTPPLARSFVTPRSCPQCMRPLSRINRYSTAQKVAELRLLERKHQRHNLAQFQALLVTLAEKRTAIQNPRTFLRGLLKCRFGEAKRNAADLDHMLCRLQKLLAEVGSGPMTVVNETIPVHERLQNAEQRIDMYQTEALIEMGRACLPHISAVAREDAVYSVARGALQSAMKLTDASGSHRSGAEARLVLVEAFLADTRVTKFYWRFDEYLWQMELEANELCQWVIKHLSPGISKRLRCDARKLKAHVSDREKARVKRAAEGWRMFGVTAGYSSNWYQCPNGHEYRIGDCGGPSQYARCPECGALIGGANHVLASENKRARHM